MKNTTKLKGTGQGGKVFARIQSIYNAYNRQRINITKKENSNKSIRKKTGEPVGKKGREEYKSKYPNAQ